VTVAIDRRRDIRDDEATADLTFRVSADDIVWIHLRLGGSDGCVVVMPTGDGSSIECCNVVNVIGRSSVPYS